MSDAIRAAAALAARKLSYEGLYSLQEKVIVKRHVHVASTRFLGSAAALESTPRLRLSRGVDVMSLPHAKQ